MKFELDFLPINASEADIFEEIRRVDAIVNKKILTKADYDKHGKIHSATLSRRFGDWQKILERAGIGHKYSGRFVSEKMRLNKTKHLTNGEVIEELKKVAHSLKRESITIEDVRAHSEIISEAIIRRRFGSWVAGIKKAGLKVSEMYRQKYSDEEYFENLLNVWTHHGRQPLLREMNDTPSEISSGAYENHFDTWRKALEAFVARMNRDEKIDEQVSNTESTEEPIIQKIKKHSIPAENRHNISLGLRYKVLNRDKFKCVKDGRSPATDPTCRLHIDHIIPFSKGGKTILENLQTLCAECNLGKGNRHFQ